MSMVDTSPPRRFRAGVAIVVALIHVAAIFGLIRVFAPDLPQQVVRKVTSVLTVTVATQPSADPDAGAAPEPEGAAAEAGKMARPKETAAPPPKNPVSKKPAPPAASTGDELMSGASETGDGTGAGGSGFGAGSGRDGLGQGGGGSKAVKIAGEINSAKDYPRDSRDARIGDHVIVALTVGTDGRVKNCRIHRPSGDPEADRITCKLATERFRFRPATNASGDPIESVFGWQQRWFYPDKN